MSHSSTFRRCRTRFSALAVGALVVVAFPLVGADPAAAANADLVTTDGVGIRVDESALLGPALEEIETSLQPFVDQMIYDGAVESTPVGNPKAIYVSSNLELGFDFLPPAAGRPDGGISVNATIQDIEIQYRKKAWWHAECGIWVKPDDATINAGANVDRNRLPEAPLALNPVVATWDADPDVSTSGACWTYLIDNWFNDFFGIGQPGSVADNIEDELNATAQDLIDGLWADHVMPVINSLDAFGITFNQIRTDDHGLIVTANVDASNGLTLPGFGGPYDVANTPDSGASGSVNTLLANRGEIIASIHPNVVAQYLNAIDQALTGEYGGANPDGAAVEALILPANKRAAYTDADWYTRLVSTGPPSVTPTGPGGAPMMNLPQMRLEFIHGSDPFTPVASFSGSMNAIRMITEVRPGTDLWGPAFDNSAATLTVTRTQANPDAAAHPPASGSELAPYARSIMTDYNDYLFTPSLSLAPISVGNLSLDLCTACPRFAGDQRYTERFHVNAAP